MTHVCFYLPYKIQVVIKQKIKVSTYFNIYCITLRVTETVYSLYFQYLNHTYNV